jgi:Bacterial mobilisation protein (MobC)
MARPRQDYNGERRTAFVGFQLTPSERSQLETRAKRAGLMLSEYGRRRLLGGTFRATAGCDPQAIRDLAAAFDRFAVAIDRVGVNLNQLAHHANRERHLPALQVLQAWHKELDDIVPDRARKSLLAKVLSL